MRTHATATPFGLSLSKPCPARKPFDKLRANGGWSEFLPC